VSIRSRRARGFTVGALVVAVTATSAAACGKDTPDKTPSGLPAAAAKLPQATTFTTLKGLPLDTDLNSAGKGTVVHPLADMTVSATPGGPPVAVLPSKQLGNPTWVPVVATKRGWQEVLLPSKPNHVAGWIATGSGKVKSAHSSYVIKVNTTRRQMTLLRSGSSLGAWTVAVGAPKTPTPTGRTFLFASLAPTKQTYTPLILPVGAHSETLDTFGGGPGTVAFHGWPNRSVFGKAVTHGCVRVPADALRQLSKVPLGTPVLVSA
jgi:lipoprotein-anchoring transpeptidase ErfK/SrfK